jgi:hypothetical protein
MFSGSCFGQGIGLPLSSFCGGGAGLEPEAGMSRSLLKFAERALLIESYAASAI